MYTVTRYNVNTKAWETIASKHRAMVELITITPEIAAVLLENNKNNRPINVNHVNNLARDMREGKWTLGDSAIAIGNNKDVYNAQHRLWAIIESQTTQVFIIKWGATKEDQENYDGNIMKRKLHDVAHLKGMKIERFASSVGRYLRRQTIQYIPRKATRSEEVTFLEQHKEALDWTSNVFKPNDVKPKDKAPGSPSIGNDVASAFTRAWLYFAKDAEKRSRVELMAKGLVHASIYSDLMSQRNEGDGSFCQLVSYLASHRDNGQRGRDDRYKKTEKAIYHFVNGEAKTLRSSEEEIYPLKIELEAKVMARIKTVSEKESTKETKEKVLVS